MSAAFAHQQFPAPSIHAVEDLYTNLGYARVLYDRLCVQMREFEDGLGEGEELAGLLASFGREMLVRITDIGYHNPYFMVFYGEDLSTNERVQLVQHVSQVSVLFKAVPKPNEVPQARRIGFGARAANV